MEYSSLLFIYGFFPLSLLAYYISPDKLKNAVLFIISIIFCGMINLYFLGFTIIYILINYLLGIAIEKAGKYRYAALMLTVIAVAADLFIWILFKTELFSFIKIADYIKNIILPVGIGFMTLNGLGYIFDVYGKKTDAEKNFIYLGLYMIFFAKLFMGPLIRYSSFKKLLVNRKNGLQKVGSGLEKFVFGLAKKVIAADNLLILFNAVQLMNVKEISALSAWLGSVSYLLYIYFTLSGISDMGAGLSLCFGFVMPKSFDHPCISTGINNFCGRWHIPVVHWFKRYIALPINHKFRSEAVKYITPVIMWGLIGLWYECSLQKLLWGALIGIAAAIEKAFLDQKALKATTIIYTSVFLLFNTVFFFSDDLKCSLLYILAMIGGNNRIADDVSLYLLRYYIVIILIGIYVSTGFLRNITICSNKKVIKNISNICVPFVVTALLIVCTSLIAYNGCSSAIPISI